MCATIAGRDSVTIGVDETVPTKPRNGPFDGAVATLFLGLARENLARDLMFLAKRSLKIVLQATREVEHGLFRCFLLWVEQGRIAVPADFNPAKQISFRPRHAIKTMRIELRCLAENIRVWMETDAGAATIMHFAEFFQPALRNTPRETLAIKTAIARDFHFQHVGKGIHHRNTDAVQTA